MDSPLSAMSRNLYENCSTPRCFPTHILRVQLVIAVSVTVQLSPVQDGVYALEKAHMRFTLSQKFPRCHSACWKVWTMTSNE